MLTYKTTHTQHPVKIKNNVMNGFQDSRVITSKSILTIISHQIKRFLLKQNFFVYGVFLSLINMTKVYWSLIAIELNFHSTETSVNLMRKYWNHLHKQFSSFHRQNRWIVQWNWIRTWTIACSYMSKLISRILSFHF